MKDYITPDENQCSVMEEKRFEFDMAYCDATYDSEEGRNRCYLEAKELSAKREYVCNHS